MINTHSMHKGVKGYTKCFGIQPLNGEKLGDRRLTSRNFIERIWVLEKE